MYFRTIRPITPYIAEIRPDTSQNKIILKTTEVALAREITDKLINRKTIENKRKVYKIENINEWV